jgi:hypothetical protein
MKIKPVSLLSNCGINISASGIGSCILSGGTAKGVITSKVKEPISLDVTWSFDKAGVFYIVGTTRAPKPGIVIGLLDVNPDRWNKAESCFGPPIGGGARGFKVIGTILIIGDAKAK